MAKKRKKPKRLPPAKIALRGETNLENLPYSVVYYPNLYGTFFGFAQDDSSPVFFCSCCEPAIENLFKLTEQQVSVNDSNPFRLTVLDRSYFPESIAERALEANDLLKLIQYRDGLCHRCNLITPSLRYCHEMYGTQCVQQYGWYINQTYLSLGIARNSLDYLPDVCLSEYQADIETIKKAHEERQIYEEDFHEKHQSRYRVDDRDYWVPRYDERRRLDRVCQQAARTLSRKIENITRQEFGFRRVGEGWVSESILHQIVSRIYPNQKIIRHHRPDWLEGLEIDIYLPELKLGFEYQGQQHFHPIKAWGGEKALENLRERDAKKAAICVSLGISLVAVDYTEPLTEEHIRSLVIGLSS